MKAGLCHQDSQLNPVRLRDDIDYKIAKLWKNPSLLSIYGWPIQRACPKPIVV